MAGKPAEKLTKLATPALDPDAPADDDLVWCVVPARPPGKLWSATPLRAGLYYARRGIPVHPVCPRDHGCENPGKIPYDPIRRCHADHGELSTADEAVIKDWIRRDPEGRLNVGAPTGGVSGLIRLDIDGERGRAEYEELRRRWRERTGRPLPQGALFSSSKGSVGVLYAVPYGVRVETVGMDRGHQGLRLEGDGSQTVLPPSRHASGTVYRFVEGRALWETGLVMLSETGVRLLVQLAREVTGGARGGKLGASETPSVELPDELPEVDVASLRIPERLRAIIREGLEADPEHRYASRSEAVWAVINAMLDAGYDPATIAAVLLDPTNAISERHFQKAADARRYVVQELQRALRHRAGRSRGKVVPLRPGDARAGTSVPALAPPAWSYDPLEEAQKTLHRALEAAEAADPERRIDLLFSEDVIVAAAWAYLSMPVLYQKALQAVKAAKLSTRDWQRRVRLKAHELHGYRSAPTDLSTIFDDPPLPMGRIPPGYFLTEDGTYRETVERDGQVRRTRIAPAPVLVVGILRDREEGTQALRLAWRRPHGLLWFTVEVDRGVAFNARKIVDLASQGLPVDSNTAPELVRYLHAFEAVNADALPVEIVSSHLGWQGDGGELGFLWGKKLLTGESRGPQDERPRVLPDVRFRPKAPGDAQIAAGFHARGSLQGWLEAVALIAEHPWVRLALYEAFVPPLLSIVGAPNHALDFAGVTSKGKTAALRVAASVWGNPDITDPHSVIGTWDATNVWVERASAVLHDLPLFLDDTKQVRKPEQVAQVLYTVANGRGRGRGNVRGLSQVQTWRTVLLSSGEQRATAFTQDGGVRARTLEVTGLPFGRVDPEAGRLVDRLVNGVLSHYGHAGPLFVNWLIRNRDRWEAFRRRYEELAEHYTEHASGAVRRIARIVAAVHLAAELVHRAFEEEGVPLPFPFTDPIAPLWAELAVEAGEAPPEVRALRDIEALAYSRQERFIGRHQEFDGKPRAPSEGWAGRWDRGDDWQYIAFHPPVLRRWLEELGYEPDGVISGWAQRGWLDASKGHLKQMRIPGGKAWMVVLRRAAFDAAQPGG